MVSHKRRENPDCVLPMTHVGFSSDVTVSGSAMTTPHPPPQEEHPCSLLS